MQIEATEVFEFIYENYLEFKNKVDKIGFVLEGSSGSSKTVSIIQFLMVYSQCNQGKKITCGRAKMTWTIDSIWNDTNELFDKYHQNFYNNKSKYRLYHNGNTFKFIGADDPQKFHGPRQDVFWFNEAMELSKNSFDQVDMRTNELFFLDYNPSLIKHWIFDTLLSGMQEKGIGEYKIVEVPDEKGRVIKVAIFFLRSTFRMNPFLPAGQRQKILGYEPTEENKAKGTADERMWRIYGQGLRAQPRGLVFPDWNEYDELPKELELHRFLGYDPGGNDPHAVSETFISHKYGVIYTRELLYKPDVSTQSVIELFKRENQQNDIVICDSARRDKILDLEIAGIMAIGIKKTRIEQGIDMMKQYTIYIHRDSINYKNEFSSYKYVENIKEGSFSDIPEDKNNHLIDQLRYIVTFFHQNYL